MKSDTKIDALANPQAAQVAAIAAGMFAALGLAAAGTNEHDAADANVPSSSISNWKNAGRGEALR